MSRHRTDPLTGLSTRAYAQAMLEDVVAHAFQGERIGIVLLDLDNFKSFNQIWGYMMGDVILMAMARMIDSIVGRDYVAARLGGDEFLIVMPNAEANETLALAGQIRAGAASVLIEDEGRTVGPLSLTGGVACFPDDGDSAQMLLEAADAAHFWGKNSGKNCVVAARDLNR